MEDLKFPADTTIKVMRNVEDTDWTAVMKYPGADDSQDYRRVVCHGDTAQAALDACAAKLGLTRDA